ncbi:MAG: hypothetical protein IKJ39_03745 [Lachnospiraceae bacterium]|nr:hypothetical protein [Lachnospiraceae bacterium]
MKNRKNCLILLISIIIPLLFSGCVYKRAIVPPATAAPTSTTVVVTPAPTNPPTATPTSEPVAVATDAPAHVPDITAAPTVQPTETPATTKVPAATVVPADTPAPEDTGDWYQYMLDTSILSEGTNGRLEQVLDKINRGEEITVFTIGGSITEGAGARNFTYSYTDQFVNRLLNAYPDSNMHYYNSGLGGTPSTLGLMRYERDVVAIMKGDPDLVIIEFAVNDYQEPTNARAYESLVRTILEKENTPAVILLFSVFESKWNMQEQYISIGNHYGLPMVSIRDAIATAYTGGNLTDKEFFADIYHPTDYGHAIMADCLMELCTRVGAKGAVNIAPIPETDARGCDFMDLRLVTASDNAGAVITPGSFTGKDNALQTYSRTAKAVFPDNWMHTTDGGTDSFKVELTCKNILLSYKFSSSTSFGKVCVYIDGKFVTTLNGYLKGGWNNIETVLLLDEDTAAPHVLELKPAEGHEAKNFTVLAIGYTP